MANILAIQEKLVRLISAENQQGTRIGTKTFLQESSPDSLNWTDARLDSFLENAVRAKFSDHHEWLVSHRWGPGHCRVPRGRAAAQNRECDPWA
jgi:hypothetical protein